MALKKIVLFLFFCSCSMVASAQSAKVSVVMQDAPLSEVFQTIEKQTGLTFAYNQSKFDTSKKVSVSKTNAALSEVLDQIFKDSGFSYAIQKNHIMVKENGTEGARQKNREENRKQTTYSLTGYVVDSATGEPISFATATLVGTGKTANSNKHGEFVIKNIVPGQYVVEASANKYSEKDSRVSVHVSHDTIVRIPLSRASVSSQAGALTTMGQLANTGDSAQPYEYEYKPWTDVVQIKEGLDSRNAGKRFGSISPNLALKTNLLYDATTTMNLGVEFRITDRNTIELSANYNPWTFKDNKKIAHTAVSAELRRWMCNPFHRHFVGLHVTYARFNWGGVNMPLGLMPSLEDNRYQGNFYSAGVSYGYSWALSNRFSLEATVGVGYAYIDYKKYECRDCGRYNKSGHTHYFGPTKAGVSLVYFLK